MNPTSVVLSSCPGTSVAKMDWPVWLECCLVSIAQNSLHGGRFVKVVWEYQPQGGVAVLVEKGCRSGGGSTMVDVVYPTINTCVLDIKGVASLGCAPPLHSAKSGPPPTTCAAKGLVMGRGRGDTSVPPTRSRYSPTA